MTPPLSEEALEAYKRQCKEDRTKPGAAFLGALSALPTDDLEALISEVRHLRSERSGYRQGLEDAEAICRTASVPIPIETWQGPKMGVSAATAIALANRIRTHIARLDVDAEQESEQIPHEGNNGG